MIVDSFDALLNCSCIGDILKKIEPFYRSATPEIENGKYPIDGDNIFALVSRYNSKPLEQGRMETHETYVDLQVIVSGKEWILCAPNQGVEPTVAYNKESDIAFWTSPKSYSKALICPGIVGLFFPHELHMPQIQADTAEPIVKIVIKIKASLFK